MEDVEMFAVGLIIDAAADAVSNVPGDGSFESRAADLAEKIIDGMCRHRTELAGWAWM